MTHSDMKKVKSNEYMDRIVAHLKRGELALGEEVAVAMERELGRPMEMAFANSVVHNCGKAAGTAGAGWAAAWISSRGMKPTVVTFNSLIATCARSGDSFWARKWWGQMLAAGETPNVLSYNTMIKALSEAMDTEGAESCLQEMINQNLSPCKVTFGTLIHLYGKLGQLERAENMYRRSQQERIQPDLAIFNSLINACAKVGNVSKAEMWFAEIQKHGIHPDVKTYNTLISACAKADLVQRAESWFMEMESVGCKIDVISYGAIIHANAKVGDLARAIHWLDRMDLARIQPNAICFDTVLRACLLKHDPHTASALVQRMIAFGLRPQMATFNTILALFAQSNDEASVGSCLRLMISQGCHPDRTTYSGLARAFQSSGHSASEKKGTCRSKVAASREAYLTLIKALIGAGHDVSARQWITSMLKAGHQATNEMCDEIVATIHNFTCSIGFEPAARVRCMIATLYSRPSDTTSNETQGGSAPTGHSREDDSGSVLESLGLLVPDISCPSGKPRQEVHVRVDQPSESCGGDYSSSVAYSCSTVDDHGNLHGVQPEHMSLFDDSNTVIDRPASRELAREFGVPCKVEALLPFEFADFEGVEPRRVVRSAVGTPPGLSLNLC
eukprot:TRINITY_DN27190_c0_g1_i1.p1 TRINITY_DN27190_c0_g1~~TRINITY_DN27190_c0_g1_i1.p1  ORF type:complete len:617 (+),score=52.11 TRINITY_DN27190_c0_g1_i1:133-1983(+)